MLVQSNGNGNGNGHTVLQMVDGGSRTPELQKVPSNAVTANTGEDRLQAIIAMLLVELGLDSKYPPAKPEALRLLAPQRGLFATVESKSKNKSKSLVLQTSQSQFRKIEGEQTPGTVKLLLPPRQSRGISLFD
jgi:hypothetical protein